MMHVRLDNGKAVNTKMLGCFNPNLGQIWTTQNVGLKMYS